MDAQTRQVIASHVVITVAKVRGAILTGAVNARLDDEMQSKCEFLTEFL
jgi:hypothetical protein